MRFCDSYKKHKKTNFECLCRPLLLSSCIFPEDKESSTVYKSILDCIKDKATLLDQLWEIDEDMFGDTQDIPLSDSMGLAKLDAPITPDNFPGAQLTSVKLTEKIKA